MAQSILIVDDERDIVSMLNQYFCKIGYVVYTAINGKEALNAITKHPDIILLDINMPDMNGFTICEKIRNFVSCPIIFFFSFIKTDCPIIRQPAFILSVYRPSAKTSTTESLVFVR